ncbi:hypothetical protein Hanom_Chr10g00942531 [Helianthus anomalus]
MEREFLYVKKKLHWTPDTEKKAAAATATEERDKIAVDLVGFVATMKENDEAHRDILAKMEESLTQLRNAYDQMIKERDFHKSGDADLKVKMEAMEKSHGAEVEDLKLEIADLNKRMDELRSTKVFHLIEGAQLLAKHVYKGPEIWLRSTTL